MDPHPGAPSGRVCGDVYRARTAPAQVPRRRRGCVTEDAARRERSRHPVALGPEHGVPHGVNPAMKAMKAAGCEPAVDRVVTQAERDELPSRDDAVLPAREPGDSQVRVR